MHVRNTAEYTLRAGLAFSFLYPPISAFFTPFAWVGYFPSFVAVLPVSEITLLHTFGIVEVILAFWILSGWRRRVSGSIAALVLLLIVYFNIGQMDVIFRDISLVAMAISFALIRRHEDTVYMENTTNGVEVADTPSL